MSQGLTTGFWPPEERPTQPSRPQAAPPRPLGVPQMPGRGLNQKTVTQRTTIWRFCDITGRNHPVLSLHHTGLLFSPIRLSAFSENVIKRNQAPLRPKSRDRRDPRTRDNGESRSVALRRPAALKSCATPGAFSRNINSAAFWGILRPSRTPPSGRVGSDAAPRAVAPRPQRHTQAVAPRSQTHRVGGQCEKRNLRFVHKHKKHGA